MRICCYGFTNNTHDSSLILADTHCGENVHGYAGQHIGRKKSMLNGMKAARCSQHMRGSFQVPMATAASNGAGLASGSLSTASSVR